MIDTAALGYSVMRWPVTIFTATTTATVLALMGAPNLSAAADAPGTTTAPSQSAAPTTHATPTPTATTKVVLPTGDVVMVSKGPDGTTRAAPISSVTGGSWASYGDATGTSLLIPRSVYPLVGTKLDPELFDTTKLATRPRGRTPVTITYASSAATTQVAGVDVTARDGATGTGFITPATSRDLASKLTAKRATSLWANVTNIRVADAAPEPLADPTAADRPKVTLTLRIIGLDGRVMDGMLGYINTEVKGDWPSRWRRTQDGQVTIQVHTGAYQLMTSIPSPDWSKLYYATTPEVKVTGPTTIDVDLRTATTSYTSSVFKPLGRVNETTLFDRTILLGKNQVWGSVTTTNPKMQVMLSPTIGIQRGQQTVSHLHHGLSPLNVKAAYQIDAFSFHEGRVPTTPIIERATLADALTADTRAYGPPNAAQSWMDAGVSVYSSVGAFVYLHQWGPIPARHFTHYVTGPPGFRLYREYTPRSTGGAVLGIIYGRDWDEGAGSTVAEQFDKAPLHSRWGQSIRQPGDPQECAACFGSGLLFLAEEPLADNDPYHVGSPETTSDELFPSFTVTADGRVLAQGKNEPLIATMPIPADANVITTDLVAKRVGPMWPFTKVRTRTATPVAASMSWPAERCTVQTDSCRILPALSAFYDAPVTLQNVLPVGKRTIGITLAQVGRDTPVGIETVRAWMSYDGHTWTEATVTGSGANYSFTTNSQRATPTNGSANLKLYVKDAAGSTLTETITGAFQLAR